MYIVRNGIDILFLLKLRKEGLTMLNGSATLVVGSARLGSARLGSARLGSARLGV